MKLTKKNYELKRKINLSSAKDTHEFNTITPLVKILSCIISLPKDFNSKKNYSDHLINKYK